MMYPPRERLPHSYLFLLDKAKSLEIILTPSIVAKFHFLAQCIRSVLNVNTH